MVLTEPERPWFSNLEVVEQLAGDAGNTNANRSVRMARIKRKPELESVKGQVFVAHPGSEAEALKIVPFQAEVVLLVQDRNVGKCEACQLKAQDVEGSKANGFETE